MTIEILPGDYILGFWFAEDKDPNNWLCCIKKDGATGWDIRFRFRYNVDGKIFNSKDERHWQYYKSEGHTEEEMLAKHDAIFSVIKLRYPLHCEAVLIKDFNSQKIMQMLMNKSWFHLDKKKTNRMNKKAKNKRRKK